MAVPPAKSPVCARCPAVHGRSCCEVEEGQRLATLTHADAARVSAATGLAPRRFLEEEWLTEDEAHTYESRRPLYRGYFRRAPVRWTLQRRGGACVFHRPGAGCRLEPATRPLACLLYPFEPWPDGSLTLLVGRSSGPPACLAVDEAEAFEELLAAFGVSLGQVMAWGERLKADSLAHGLVSTGGRQARARQRPGP